MVFDDSFSTLFDSDDVDFFELPVDCEAFVFGSLVDEIPGGSIDNASKNEIGFSIGLRVVINSTHTQKISR